MRRAFNKTRRGTGETTVGCVRTFIMFHAMANKFPAHFVVLEVISKKGKVMSS